MADKHELAAELYDLWKAGAILLPQVAAAYAQSSRDLHNTGWHQGQGFERPQLEFEPGSILPTGVSISQGPVLPWVAALRDDLERAIADTADNVAATGEALVAVGNAYAGQDTEVAEQVKELRDERGTEPELDQPPTVPETRRPGDPYEVTVETDPDGTTTEVPRR